MKDLLESGVHFGHQTRRWNPKMAPYIFTERNGIHIIDLQKTMAKINEAIAALHTLVRSGGGVLFVGTKKQAQAAVRQAAEQCGMYYVSNRWLGGTLTNFITIRKTIERLRRLEKMETDGTFSLINKKERLGLVREKEKLEKNVGGIKNMSKLPDAIIIFDPKREAIAVNEARTLGIPIFAIVDTNCDPTVIDYVIPGNDDAIRAIKLFAGIFSTTVIEAAQEAGRVLESHQTTAGEGFYSSGSESFESAEEEAAATSFSSAPAVKTGAHAKAEAKSEEELLARKDAGSQPAVAPTPASAPVAPAVASAPAPAAPAAPAPAVASAPAPAAAKSQEAAGTGAPANFTAEDVKRLRDKTAAGMMDCKRALVETNGDFEKAMLLLREKGLADAAKRVARATKEGMIASASNGKKAVLIEVNCETDFVAKNEVFADFAALLAKSSLASGKEFNSVEDLDAATSDELKLTISKLGENITIRRSGSLSADAGYVSCYAHGGRIAAIVSFAFDKPELADNADFQSYARDVAMQVASMSPVALNRDGVPAKVIEDQKEVLRRQSAESGKPAEIIEKMLDGQLSKFFKEITLVDQAYIRDNKMTITELTKSVGDKLGAAITISGFKRFMIGEELE
jgi:small subunit ribosomal protein S2